MSFGDGSHGALGLPMSLTGIGGDAYEPTVVPGLPSDISSVSAGHYHSLAVTSGGALWAWGRNNEAQLGRSLLAPRSIINLWFNFVLIVFFFFKYACQPFVFGLEWINFCTQYHLFKLFNMRQFGYVVLILNANFLNGFSSMVLLVSSFAETHGMYRREWKGWIK